MKKIFINLLATMSLFAAPISENERAQAYAKLFKTFRIIESAYVDEINTKELVEKALTGLLSELDAHSSYLNAKNYQSMQESTKGEFGGLGITVGMKDKALTVIAPIEGTPAAKAGIKSGDVIIKINDELTSGISLDDAVEKMRGKPGTKITLEIFRQGESKPQKKTITRDIIQIKSVYAKTIEDSDALYIRITNFDEKVVASVSKALDEHPKASGAIIDLRSNPGGLLDQATGLLNLFIKKGILVSQKGRDENDKIDTKAVASKAKYDQLPLVVIVDAGSASASEIVSGALQDHHRAIIVGEKTFGKGSVQFISPINESEAIKLTVAKYYLPSGRTIQALGVTPDIITHPGKLAESNDAFSYTERDLSRHLDNEQQKASKSEQKSAISEQSEGQNDEKNEKIITKKQIFADAQLKSAIDALNATLVLKAKR